METTSFKIVIAAFRDGVLTGIIRDGSCRLLDFQGGGKALVGSIYLGRVSHIVKNIEAAFVDIGEGEPAYYGLDSNPDHLYTDGKKHERLKEGDEIIVKIRKDAAGTKAAVCTSRFRESESAEMLKSAGFRKAPCLLNPAEPFWLHLIRSRIKGEDFETVTDLPDVRDRLAAEGFACRLYEDPLLPLAKLYSLETAVSEALARNVWLKGGGYLVIEPTEAMTVIDVNTGKTDAKGSKEEIIFRTNCEAAEETARQLRLRNLSGIIMVDFINQKDSGLRECFLEKLRGFLAEDPVETKLIEMTQLDIAEIVRRKSGRPFAEQIGANRTGKQKNRQGLQTDGKDREHR